MHHDGESRLVIIVPRHCVIVPRHCVASQSGTDSVSGVWSRCNLLDLTLHQTFDGLAWSETLWDSSVLDRGSDIFCQTHWLNFLISARVSIHQESSSKCSVLTTTVTGTCLVPLRTGTEPHLWIFCICFVWAVAHCMLYIMVVSGVT